MPEIECLSVAVCFGSRHYGSTYHPPAFPRRMKHRWLAFQRLLLSLVASNLIGTAVAAEASPPNIVLILADDLGWSDIGCYGGEIPTPNLDRLAAEGLRFTQFYNNSVCGPSRASLLTGLYAQRIGHTGRHWNQLTDYTCCLTFGEALQRAGYHTMMVGKWQDPDLPVHRGFNRFFGPITGGISNCDTEVSHIHYSSTDYRASLIESFHVTGTHAAHLRQFSINASPFHGAVQLADGKIIGFRDDGPWGLFELAAEGTETTYFATDHPDRVAQLAARWREWEASTHVRP